MVQNTMARKIHIIVLTKHNGYKGMSGNLSQGNNDQNPLHGKFTEQTRQFSINKLHKKKIQVGSQHT